MLGNGAQRRFAVGAEIVGERGAHFRVWAPERKRVEVVLEPEGRSVALARNGRGYWEGLVPGLRAGARYRLRLDGERTLYADPVSRFQPEGPHGPSELIDPRFPWRDRQWRGRPLPGQVLYELHIGTFSPEGTFRGAAARLPHLRDLGVTAIEVLPVASFPGAFGWGYDGVALFAPHQGYGRPEDLRHLVDEAHGLGLCVILDVVYNHLGPDGSTLQAFSPYYTSAEKTDWGGGINYDGENAGPVRELVTTNAAYWISEFHADGFRVDAAHAFRDRSPEHILAAIARAARAAAPERSVLVIAEHAFTDIRVVEPRDRGGYALDAVWNDDFHHAAVVALTGRAEAYYSDYGGTPQELVSLAKHGPLYRGQWAPWTKKRRGSPLAPHPPSVFITCLENHDQVANSAAGERLWRLSGARRHRAMATFFLLGPWTPLLFQGEEWGSTRPFLYFADHKDADLARLVSKGRREFLAQFPSLATEEVRRTLPSPSSFATFDRSRLDWSELDEPEHAATLTLYRDLLALRRSDPIVRAQGEGVVLDGAVLAAHAFALRLRGRDAEDRLLIVNLGPDLALSPPAEPLLAPPEGRQWQVVLSSEDPRYGGAGARALDGHVESWHIAACSSVFLAAIIEPEPEPKPESDRGAR